MMFKMFNMLLSLFVLLHFFTTVECSNKIDQQRLAKAAEKKFANIGGEEGEENVAEQQGGLEQSGDMEMEDGSSDDRIGRDEMSDYGKLIYKSPCRINKFKTKLVSGECSKMVELRFCHGSCSGKNSCHHSAGEYKQYDLDCPEGGQTNKINIYRTTYCKCFQ